MVCKNCGTEFNEGIFCPECGTKIEVEENTKSVSSEEISEFAEKKQKAYDILTEYEQVEKEKFLISELSWSDDKDIENRIKQRVKAYKKAKTLDLRTDQAKQLIQKMRDDIKADYYKYVREKDGSLAAHRFWAIVLTLIAVFVLFPLGIVGIIIGILFIFAGWGMVSDLKKAKRTIAVLRKLMDEI